MPEWLQFILLEFGSNPFTALWFLFAHGGAIIFIPIMVRMATKGWIFWIQEKFKHHIPYKMYRIEVPQNNEQSMKAVEQIFVNIYGTRNVPDWWERWWLGFVQEPFSFEIVSDGGYITYYIRCPKYYAEMTQAAFYAQYPDAILTETDDYTKEITVEMINEGRIQVWGSEMKLEGDDVMPIKSWPAWEHTLVGRAVDPLASILEFMSRLQPGEKLWYQIMAMPADLDHFKHRAAEAIAKIVEPGGKAHGHGGGGGWISNSLYSVLDLPVKVMSIVHSAIFGGADDEAGHHDEGLAERQRLTTPEREYVEEVDRKASRWPFETKIRFMYFAAPNIWDGKKARRGMLGGFALYRFINAFKEGVRTRTDWGCLKFRYIMPGPRILARGRKMFWAYRSRDMERGEHEGFHMSTEELASLFHFPQIEVRAPFVARASARGVEPPNQLRFDTPGLQAAGPSVNVENTRSLEDMIPLANIVPENQPGSQASEPPVRYAHIPPGTSFSGPIVTEPDPSVTPASSPTPTTVPADPTQINIESVTNEPAPAEEKGAPPANLPFV